MIATISAGLLAAMQSGESPSVAVHLPAGACTPTIEGEKLTLDQLRVHAGQWRHREVHLTADPDTSLDCFARVSDVLQNAHVRFGVLSEPEAPRK